MRQYYFTRWTSVFLSVFCAIFLSVSGMAGTLLCIGDAGHIGIEFPGKCVALPQAGERGDLSKTEMPQQNGCGACIDIPLNPGPFLQASSRAGHSHADASFVLVSSGAVINPTCSKRPSSLPPDYSGDHISTFPIDVLRI